ncbi:MAG: inositol monophosphatase family protein [Rhizobiaceae bacterium]
MFQDDEISERLSFAKTLANRAGKLALGYFRNIADLQISSKGTQDMVSNADLEVETFVRNQIAGTYPDDGIVGEEHENKTSRSGYTWVIDPIDGTANFVNGLPAWCVILACVHDDQVKIAAIAEPSHGELYWAAKGKGAYLNNKPLKVSHSPGVDQGNTAVGMNSRTPRSKLLHFLKLLTDRNGLFFRNASGGLGLCYVAAGRLIGYVEPHMNAWDCLAGQLLVAEAGGRVEQQSANTMLVNGGRVIASGPLIFDDLVDMADQSFG